MEKDPHKSERQADSETDKNDTKRSRRKELGVVAVESPEAKPRKRQPEAHEHQGQPEHLGKFLVAAEAKKPLKTTLEKRPDTARRYSAQQIETLSRAELLKLSKEIIVDNSSLRQIYETHLIGERGLRRLIIEHLKGGDVKKALRLEILEREMDFERDPAMRDMALSMPKIISAAKGDRTELNKLLAKASMQLAGSSEEVAFFRARADFEAKQLSQQQKQRRLLDFMFVSTILVLLTFVLWLALGR